MNMNCDSDTLAVSNPELDMLHEIGNRIAAANPLPDVLSRAVELISAVVECDSCFLYVLEGEELVLRASKNPHAEAVDRLKLKVGQGITGWVAEHRTPVAVESEAFRDPRFRAFNELPEDQFQAFLSVPVISRDKVVGVINLQHSKPHEYCKQEIHLISTIGFMVGAEIEMARLEGENSELSEQLETRKVIERAKGILQQELQLSEQEAYITLQRHSRQKRKPMKEIAEAIVLSDDVKRAPGKPRPS